MNRELRPSPRDKPSSPFRLRLTTRLLTALLPLLGACRHTDECGARTTCDACLRSPVDGCGWCAGACTDGDDAGPDGDGFPYCTTWVRDAAQCARDSGATKALRRDRGLFVRGDAPADTLDDSKAAQGKIRQVIVLIQENHSMDNMFGFTRIPDVNSLRAPTLPLPSWTPAPFRLSTTCPTGPPHQWADMHAQWSDGTLAGMADVDVGAMGVYMDDDHPFYTSLGAQFGLADRYFGSALGGTWANRNYLYLGTSQGIEDTGQLPFPSATSIFDELDAAHVKWAYSAKRPLHAAGAGATRIAEGTLGFRFAPGGRDFGRIVPYEEFLAEVDAFDPAKSDPMLRATPRRS